MFSLPHKEVEKQEHKAWHDRNLRKNDISIGDLILLYDSIIKEKPRKLETNWLGPYTVEDMRSNGVVELRDTIHRSTK